MPKPTHVQTVRCVNGHEFSFGVVQQLHQPEGGGAPTVSDWPLGTGASAKCPTCGEDAGHLSLGITSA